MSYEGIFVRINYARLHKKIVIARKRSARFVVSSALGALGRRFESCRPDHLKTKSYKRVTQTLFFIANYKKNKT